MAVTQSSDTFFAYLKSLIVLVTTINLVSPTEKATRLVALCPTRWVERHTSVLKFFDLLLAIVKALEKISETWTDKETVSSAVALLNSIQDGGFIVTLKIVAAVSAVSAPLSVQLQSKDLDLAEALRLADGVKEILQGMRTKAEERFHDIFEEPEILCKGIDMEIKMPRRAQQQLYRCNVPAESPEEYFKKAVYIPFIDHFLVQMEERFLAHKNTLSCLGSLLPKKAVCSEGFNEEARNQARILHSAYESVLKCSELEYVGEMETCTSRLEPPRNAMNALDMQRRNISWSADDAQSSSIDTRHHRDP